MVVPPSNSKLESAFPGARTLDLSRPALMGVLNVTPDSFSDGGQFIEPGAARRQGERLVAEGAALVDVGGESTRPGAEAVPVAEELKRVIPVIQSLGALDAILSVDTSKPEVMRLAVQAGAGMINDVCALGQPGALDAAAECGVPVCLMHMQGEPRTMQASPRYDDVVYDVCRIYEARLEACVRAGIPRDRLILDPGIGFGKTLEHNLLLLRGLPSLTAAFELPLLVGVSRKSMFQHLLGRELERRLPGTLAAGLMAVRNGAAILRVHDVWEHADALAVWGAVGAS